MTLPLVLDVLGQEEWSMVESEEDIEEVLLVEQFSELSAKRRE